MRIGYDGRNLVTTQRTGIGRYFYNLLSAIDRLETGGRFYVFIPRGGGYDLHLKGVKIVRTAVPPDIREERFFRLWFDVYLPFRCVLNRIDIFHGPSYLSPSGGRSKKVVTVHDLAHEKLPQWSERHSGEFRRRVRESVESADAVIAVSERTRMDILELYEVDERKVRVIYEGVDSRFRRIEDNRLIDDFRRRHSLPERFVLSVASLHPRKNIEGMLEGFALLKKRAGLPHFLVLAGKDYGSFAIDEKVSKAGVSESFKFLNYVQPEELPLLYNCAELFVLPSFYEGFGLPPLEAMACGTPVAAAKAGSLPEVLGEAALFFDPADPVDMAEKMEELLCSGSARRKLAEMGVKHAARYRWEDAARKTLSLYAEI